MAPSHWWLSNACVDWLDNVEPVAIDDPTDINEANDPTLPTDANEPMLPIDSTEPSDAIDKIEL